MLLATPVSCVGVDKRLDADVPTAPLGGRQSLCKLVIPQLLLIQSSRLILLLLILLIFYHCHTNKWAH